MGSNNNRSNQQARREMESRLSNAVKKYWNGDYAGALASYEGSAEHWRLSSHRYYRGGGWPDFAMLHTGIQQILFGPCDCWFCSLSPEKKLFVRREVYTKFRALATVYPEDENLFTGAFAEVVFGTRFGLPINQESGFDGGVDFEVGSKDLRRLTIDVKGTTFGKVSSKDGVLCDFPRQKQWRSDKDHIYVLFHVVDRRHVHFRGFTFGNDKPGCVIYPLENGNRLYAEGLKPRRSLAELEALIPTWTAILPPDQPEEPAIREFWKRWEPFFPVDSNKQVSPERLRAYRAYIAEWETKQDALRIRMCGDSAQPPVSREKPKRLVFPPADDDSVIERYFKAGDPVRVTGYGDGYVTEDCLVSPQACGRLDWKGLRVSIGPVKLLLKNEGQVLSVRRRHKTNKLESTDERMILRTTVRPTTARKGSGKSGADASHHS
jgi:hypothetical protein